jgi:Bacteriophage clamp loader A subunit
MAQDLTPFDFIKSVSHSKKDLIRDSEYPEQIEKQYNAYIVNRGFSYFEDTILHANEMNMRAHLFNDAQYRYYLGVLRSRNRFSKWHKAEKNTDLDAIQEVYAVNRTVAKMYLKTLSKDDLKRVHEKLQKGG